eukprot:3933434-Rhodomonas_salina.2
MYLATFTRPDLAFAVNQCSSLGIMYVAQPKSRKNLLWGFADADHAGDPDTRRSVTGYVTMMCGAAISIVGVD